MIRFASYEQIVLYNIKLNLLIYLSKTVEKYYFNYIKYEVIKIYWLKNISLIYLHVAYESSLSNRIAKVLTYKDC